ncbi:MAG: flagellar hook-basal body protein [Desulfobacteraceae bacterium]|nr:flagellar hook-basal body protein [Desulfobacteraceae bacterium]MDH3573222.1 flagellar hook-basal body protein [Desulfobacteraceae bacterium]MDH3720114.1 flagellar hook-basal body protein [Desulfobacteraceae bacterium]MDH3836178.1 flagellar hook-basal body protein [Desulfobacteraceae bacterium]MDH3873913.1 flagellar hook-basal body protein [Desulfobacteraceae bacterium]
MTTGIYDLIDGSMTQQLRFETIANNMANSNTNGFKKDIITFYEALDMQTISETDFSQGPVRYTGNELDVALSSKGFFKIQTPNGLRYTRDGAFSINVERILVTGNGDTVLGQNGPITVEGGEVYIGRDGQVVVNNESVDKILVVDIDAPQLLKKEGGSYYSYQGENEEISTSTDAEIQHKYLEGSNVNPTQEMIKMIETYRAFESVEKAIQSIDELTAEMVSDVGTVT